MFVVNFVNVFGRTTVYGPFDTESAARMWMQSAWENKIDHAKKKGKKITTWMGDDNMCGIEEIGDWSVFEMERPKSF